MAFFISICKKLLKSLFASTRTGRVGNVDSGQLVLKIRNVLWFASVQSICFIFVNKSCFEKQRKRPLIRGHSDQVNFEPVLTQSWGGLEFSKGGIGQTSAYIIQLLLLLNKSFFHKKKTVWSRYWRLLHFRGLTEPPEPPLDPPQAKSFALFNFFGSGRFGLFLVYCPL